MHSGIAHVQNQTAANMPFSQTGRQTADKKKSFHQDMPATIGLQPGN